MTVIIYVFYGVMTHLTTFITTCNNWCNNYLITYLPTFVRNRFARVVFGVMSSPFLFNVVTHKHVEKYEFDAEVAQKLLESFYVDDFAGELILSLKLLNYLKN